MMFRVFGWTRSQGRVLASLLLSVRRMRKFLEYVWRVYDHQLATPRDRVYIIQVYLVLHF